ncbi:sulfotransferase [Glutamicibacter arilaitensis]|uniref:sulfotransferase n=1 Tax=Glutamicibacter arilaitensis TaxID=256701 RepID=UPI003FD1BDFB
MQPFHEENNIDLPHRATRSQPEQERIGHSKPRVLMLGGFGRSGSTVLERCLAQCEGVEAMGEVLHLWERGLRDNELCGCGANFQKCPQWRDIGAKGFGGWSVINTAEVIEDRWAIIRNRYLPWLSMQRSPAGVADSRARLINSLNKLYAAARDVTGAQILVDSSKHPAYGYFLRSLDIDLRCVLVVRDPRGVAYSWLKVVQRPETGQQAKEMPRYSIPASMGNWMAYSLMFHALSLLKVPVLTVHYEDFMDDPATTIDRVLEFSGLDAAEHRLHIDAGKQVKLDAHHTVAGNPMRFKVGSIQLSSDEQWRAQMPRAQRLAASIMSAPMRLAYALARHRGSA